MSNTLFKNITPYSITINSGDISGSLPSSIVVESGGIFVASDQDPLIRDLLTRNAISLVPATLAEDIPATDLPPDVVPSQNICWVDPAGNNSTAVRGSDTLKFKTIAAAMAAAQENDVVYLNPGTYSENVTVKSNISMIGVEQNKTVIDGDVDFSPGIGDSDAISIMQSIKVTGTILVDGTDRDNPGTAAYLYLVDCAAGAVNLIGRPGLGLDAVLFENCFDGYSMAVTASNGAINFRNSETGDVSLSGDVTIRALKSTFYGGIQADSGITSIDLIECEIFGLVNISGPVLTTAMTRFCDFLGEIRLSNAANLDIRSSYVNPATGFITLFGGSTIQRDDGPFQGTNGSDPGMEGNVPTPFTNDKDRFLRGDGGWSDIDSPFIYNTSTSDATPTALWTSPLSFDTTYVVHASIVTVNGDGSKRATYDRKALVSRTGGGAAVLNAADQIVGTDAETDAGLDAAFAVSGNNVQLIVTGLAAQNFSWKAKITKIDVNAGPS